MTSKFPEELRTSSFVCVDGDIVTYVGSSLRICVPTDNQIPNDHIMKQFDLNINGDAGSIFLLNEVLGPIYYWELEVKSHLEMSSLVAIGLVPFQTISSKTSVQLGTLPGFNHGSIGYHSSGKIFYNGEELNDYSTDGYGTCDVVGCGIEIGGNGNVFFTKNSRIVHIPELAMTESLHPVLGLSGTGTSVSLNFGSRPFLFTPSLFIVNAYGCMTSILNRHSSTDAGAGVLTLMSVESDDMFVSGLSTYESQQSMNAWSGVDSDRAREFLRFIDDITTKYDDASSLDSAFMMGLIKLPESISVLPGHKGHDEASPFLAIVYTVIDELTLTQRRLVAAIRELTDDLASTGGLLELNQDIVDVLSRVEGIFSPNKPVIERTQSRSSTVTEEHKKLLAWKMVHALRRGSKQDVTAVIGDLLMLCTSYGVEVTDTIREIRRAGVLQLLLSALTTRTSDWLDGEALINRAIAILVAHEEDSSVLCKYRHEILSALQMLLLKNNNSHSRSSSSAPSPSAGNVRDSSSNGGQRQTTHIRRFSNNSNMMVDDAVCEAYKNMLDTRVLTAAAICRICMLFVDIYNKQIDAGTSVTTQNALSSASVFNRSRVSAHTTCSEKRGGGESLEDTMLRTAETILHLIFTLTPFITNVGPPPKPVVTSRGGPNFSPLGLVTTDINYNFTPRLMIPDKSMSGPRDRRRSSSGNTPASLLMYPEEVLDTPSSPFRGLFNPVNETTEVASGEGFDRTLTDLFSGESPTTDAVMILASNSIKHLSVIVKCRTNLVQRGALQLIVGWLESATVQWRNLTALGSDDIPVLKIEDRHPSEWLSGVPLGKDVSLVEVVKNVCEAVKNITRGREQQSRGSKRQRGASLYDDSTSSLRSDSSSSKNYYDIGWVDAQVLNEGLLLSICRFLMTATSGLAANNSTSEKHGTSGPMAHLPYECGVDIAFALFSLASRKQNRQSMLDFGVPYALCCLLVDATERRFRRRNITKESSRVSDNSASSYPSKSEREEEDKWLSELAYGAFGSLGHLLEHSIDKHVISPVGSRSTPVAVGYVPGGTLADLLCAPQMVQVICSTLLSKKMPSRLSALRIVSILADWPSALEALFEGGVSDSLVIMASEANEDIYCMGSDSDMTSPAAYSSFHPIPKPKLEHGSSTGSSTSRYAYMEEVDLEALEETMYSCLALANICHAKPYFATAMFEKGVLKIMLKIVRSPYEEVHRQALRCISAICAVVSAYPLATLDTILSSVESGESTSSDSFQLSIDIAGEKSSSSASDRKNKLEHSRRIRSILQDHGPAFVETLKVLTQAVESPNNLVQEEALFGLACLAKDEQLRICIVEGPLKIIIRILVDPSIDSLIRIRAEEVLVNIGFHNGRKDLEIVGHDYQLLVDWFYMRRSLAPQMLAIEVIRHWIDALFLGNEEAEQRALKCFVSICAPQTNKSVLDWKRYDSGKDPRETLELEGSSMDLLHPPPTPSTNSPSLQSPSTLEKIGGFLGSVAGKWMSPGHSRLGVTPPTPPSPISHKVSPAVAHLEASSARRAIFEDFVTAFDAWLLFRSSDRKQDSCWIGLSRNSGSGSLTSPSSSYSNKAYPPLKRQGLFIENFLKLMKGCSQSAQQVVDEELEEHSYLMSGKLQRTNSKVGNESPNVHEDVIEAFPAKAAELLNLHFPSTLQQMLLKDMFALKVSGFRVPMPHHFRAILLPARSYLSFKRGGRVIERILEEFVTQKYEFQESLIHPPPLLSEKSSSGSSAEFEPTCKLDWALCFRDSSFHGEFHQSLLQTLRKCPQITSISFCCRRPENDEHMGVLAGNLPASVNFASFDNVLSDDALKIMCVLLRTQNPSYQPTNAGNKRGLLGLCIRGHAFCDSDINKHLIELLDPWEILSYSSECNFQSSVKHHSRNSSNKVHQRSSSNSSTGSLGDTVAAARRAVTPWNLLSSPSISRALEEDEDGEGDGAVAQNFSKSFKRSDAVSEDWDDRPLEEPVDISESITEVGLEYLDLSDNKLSDVACANIVRAASTGPLEALELSLNPCGRSTLFGKACCYTISRPYCRLRHLGLSGTNLSPAVFYELLSSVARNSSLTSLDVSRNSIAPTKDINEKFRQVLRWNKFLRILDLSHNRFTVETIKEIHFGLLENTTLLLLHLLDNIIPRTHEYLDFVSGRISANRQRYGKLQTYSSSDSFPDLQPSTSPETKASTLPRAVPVNADATGSVAYAQSASSTPHQQFFGTTLAMTLDTDVAVTNTNITDNFGSIGTMSNFPQSAVKTYRSRSLDGRRQVEIDIAALTALSETGKSDAQIAPANVLCVLFSAPLAWKDTQHRLHPIQMLDFQSEQESLWQVFKQVQRDIYVHFDFATTHTLRTLVTMGCRALHFSGHGRPGWLSFEDGRSGLHILHTEQLKELSQAGEMKLDFVFVSACHSEIAGEAFVAAGVPHVVCVKVEAQVLDTAANDFTRHFYESLAMGNTVRQAFEIGKQAVYSSPRVPNSTSEGEKFVLLPADSSHDKPVFVAPIVPIWPPKTRKQIPFWFQQLPPSKSHLPQPPEDFEGREVDMHRTIGEIVARRFVTVIGEDGIGKSAVLSAVSQYVCERKVFADGVIYVKLQGLSAYADFLHRLQRTISTGPKAVSSRMKNMILNKAVPPKAVKGVSAQTLGSFDFPCGSDNIATLESCSTMDDNDYDFGGVGHPDRASEEAILACLEPLNLLLVLDHACSLTCNANAEISADFKIFIGNLLERAKKVKILASSVSPLKIHDVVGYCTNEITVTIGPLTLGASLRLFARLTRHLATMNEKTAFVKKIMGSLPSNQDQVTVQSSGLSPAAASLLKSLGSGHPALIVKLAMESDEALLQSLSARAAPSLSHSSLNRNALRLTDDVLMQLLNTNSQIETTSPISNPQRTLKQDIPVSTQIDSVTAESVQSTDNPALKGSMKLANEDENLLHMLVTGVSTASLVPENPLALSIEPELHTTQSRRLSNKGRKSEEYKSKYGT